LKATNTVNIKLVLLPPRDFIPPLPNSIIKLENLSQTGSLSVNVVGYDATNQTLEINPATIRDIYGTFSRNDFLIIVLSGSTSDIILPLGKPSAPVVLETGNIIQVRNASNTASFSAVVASYKPLSVTGATGATGPTSELTIHPATIFNQAGAFSSTAETLVVTVAGRNYMNTANTQSLPLKIGQTTVPTQIKEDTNDFIEKEFSVEKTVEGIFNTGDTVYFREVGPISEDRDMPNSFQATVFSYPNNSPMTEEEREGVNTFNPIAPTRKLVVRNIVPIAPADRYTFGTRFNPKIFSIHKYLPKNYSTDTVNSVSPIDFIDCKSLYALKIIGISGSVNTKNINKLTCGVRNSNSVKYYIFSKTGSSKIFNAKTELSETPSITVTESDTPLITAVNTLTISSSCGFEENSDTVRTFLTSVIGVIPKSSVPAGAGAWKGNAIRDTTTGETHTYEYRINTNNKLPFGDTYKKVGLYSPDTTSCNYFIKSYADSVLGTSNFTFIKGLNGTNVTVNYGPGVTGDTIPLSDFVNKFREYFNREYDKKQMVGNVVRTLYKNGLLIFIAETAQYGSNGPNDIRNYEFYYRYDVEFRYNFDGNNTYKDGANYEVYRIINIEEASINNEILATGKNFTDPANGIIQPKTNVKLTDITDFRVFNQYTDNWTNPAPPSYQVVKWKDAMKSYSFRYIRLSVLEGIGGTGATFSSGGNIIAEISKIILFTASTPNNTNSEKGYARIVLDDAVLTMSDLSGSYANYGVKQVCKPGFRIEQDPTRSSTNLCTVANPTTYTYNKLSKEVCGVGFYSDGDKTCISNGILVSVADIITEVNSDNNSYGVMPTSPNESTPNLKFTNLNNKYLTIYFSSGEKNVTAFSFVTGFEKFRPVRWLVEGSMNGLLWKEVHNKYKTSKYVYPTNVQQTITSKQPIHSYVMHAIYPIQIEENVQIDPVPRADSIIKTELPERDTLKRYVDYGPAGSTSVISETFINPSKSLSLLVNVPPPQVKEAFYSPPETLEPSYALPLEQEAVDWKARSFSQVKSASPAANRIRMLRFKVLETANPASKFVHMSMFRLNTPLGPLGKPFMTLSNPMSTRRSPKDGPDSAVADTTNLRWVDYNKQPLIIQFNTLPPAPIKSYEFSVPTGVANPYDAMPSNWLLEGSFDGRSWFIYDDQSDTPVSFKGVNQRTFKLSKEI
jgi:hypothetical protein